MKWVDSMLQRRFDAVFTWLMRRGVPKKVIRGRLCLLHAFGVLGSLFPLFQRLELAPFGVVFAGLHVWQLGNGVEQSRRNDEAAERVGCANWNDVTAWTDKAGGFFWLGLACVGALNGDSAPAITARCTAGVAAIALGYLGRTPPTKPQKKEERAGLFWARAWGGPWA